MRFRTPGILLGIVLAGVGVTGCGFVTRADSSYQGVLNQDQVASIQGNTNPDNTMLLTIADPFWVENGLVKYALKGDAQCQAAGSQSDRDKCPPTAATNDKPYILLQLSSAPTNKHKTSFVFSTDSKAVKEVVGPPNGVAAPGYDCSLNQNQKLTAASITGMYAAVKAQAKANSATATVISDGQSFYCGITFAPSSASATPKS